MHIFCSEWGIVGYGKVHYGICEICLLLGAVQQQAITWINVDPDICCHMASLGQNEVRPSLNHEMLFQNVVWGWMLSQLRDSSSTIQERCKINGILLFVVTGFFFQIIFTLNLVQIWIAIEDCSVLSTFHVFKYEMPIFWEFGKFPRMSAAIFILHDIRSLQLLLYA